MPSTVGFWPFEDTTTFAFTTVPPFVPVFLIFTLLQIMFEFKPTYPWVFCDKLLDNLIVSCDILSILVAFNFTTKTYEVVAPL